MRTHCCHNNHKISNFIFKKNSNLATNTVKILNKTLTFYDCVFAIAYTVNFLSKKAIALHDLNSTCLSMECSKVLISIVLTDVGTNFHWLFTGCSGDDYAHQNKKKCQVYSFVAINISPRARRTALLSSFNVATWLPSWVTLRLKLYRKLEV